MAKTGKDITIKVVHTDSSNNQMESYYAIPEHDDRDEQNEQIKKLFYRLAGKLDVGVE